MTENSILYADPYIPWYQSATTLRGNLWCVQGGVIVAGSQTVNNPVNPAKTGNTPNDLQTWIQAALLSLMGGAPPPDAGYVYPNPLPAINDWGINVFAAGNTFKDRPFVALGYTNDFQFGALNIPTYDTAGPRQWFFRITGKGTSALLSPGYNAIKKYNTDQGANPILQVLELNPE
jgi:hypothetical protein